MKKVMFVIGTLSGGGSERVISILAKEMLDYGYDVSIVTIYNDRNDYINNNKIRLHPIKHKNKSRLIKSFNIIRTMHKLIKSENPDIIISFDAPINIYTILSRAFKKNKLIVSERNDPSKYPENKLVRKLRDYLYLLVDGIVFQTINAKRYFSNSIQAKGTIIHNPILPNLPYWNKESKEKTIMTACRLVKQKNLPMLIKAFSRFLKIYPEYNLKIFGEGELRGELLNLIEELQLKEKVFLLGFTRNIHREMANSDLFIISSNYEGISNSMLEALAIGVPVISTNPPTGGAKMFINDGVNGLLIDVGDVDGLVDAMVRIISDKEYAISLSNEACKIRTSLSAEKITQQWIQYAKAICRGNHG